MPLMHARLQPKTGHKSQRKNSRQQPQGKPLQRAAEIEPLRQEMEQGDDRAQVVQEKITFDDNLRDGSVIRGRKKGFHLLREKNRLNKKGQGNSAAKPDGRIDDADKSERANHAASVSN